MQVNLISVGVDQISLKKTSFREVSYSNTLVLVWCVSLLSPPDSLILHVFQQIIEISQVQRMTAQVYCLLVAVLLCLSGYLSTTDATQSQTGENVTFVVQHKEKQKFSASLSLKIMNTV